MVVEPEEAAAPDPDDVVGEVGADEAGVEDRDACLGDRDVLALDPGVAVVHAGRSMPQPTTRRATRHLGSRNVTVASRASGGPAVRRGHDRDDGQPESGAAARPRLVGAGEALEGMRREASGKPAPGSDNLQDDRVVVGAPGQHDLPGAVLQGVGHEVAECLLQAQAVGAQRETCGRLHTQRPALTGGLRAEAHRDVVEQPCDVHVLGGERQLPRSARASTSRSSESRVSRATSSWAEPSASRSWSGVRSRPRASSSSVVRIASGVRNSWLASATSARSRSTARCRRPSIAFSVPASRDSSSSPAGPGAPPSVLAGDLVRAATEPLDRPERGGDGHPSGQAGERERARQAVVRSPRTLAARRRRRRAARPRRA